MPLQTSDQPVRRRTAPGAQPRPKRGKAAAIVIVSVLGLLCVGVILAILKWPFTQSAFRKSLEQDSQARVSFGSFHQSYFPHPGCVAEQVVIERDASSPRLTVRRVELVGSYIGLLAHYVPKVIAQGAVLNVPAGGLKQLFADRTPGQRPTGTKIGELAADDAKIVVQTSEPKTPLAFQFHKLRLESVSRDAAVRFNAFVGLPDPQGDLTLQGSIGPFRRGNAGDTPLSGSYALTKLKLSDVSGIGGVLSSEGKFHGHLRSIDVQGTTDTPDFQVDEAEHRVDLKTQFHAVVNGTTGDLQLQPVDATFGKTHVVASGSIDQAARAQQPEGLSLDLACPSGTVQDLLLLFIHEDKSPMVGAIKFRAHALLPPGEQGFLDKLRLEGDFGIAGAKYTDPHTQKEVNIMSARARGRADKIEDDQDRDRKNGTQTVDEDLERVVSDLKGHVLLQKGIARFTNVSFDVPGASALVNGTYNLRSKAVDLRGIVRMQAKLPNTTTGAKSFLMRIIEPFTKHSRKTGGSVVSFHMTGTYGHPSFAVQPMKGGK